MQRLAPGASRGGTLDCQPRHLQRRARNTGAGSGDGMRSPAEAGAPMYARGDQCSCCSAAGRVEKAEADSAQEIDDGA